MKKTFNDASNVQGYHIHIYFEPRTESEDTAREVTNQIKTRFPAEIDSVARIGKIGPHLQPNYAIHITKEAFAKIIPWLQLNAHHLSILIHPETGDELQDHEDSALWLGRQVELNNDFFRQGPAPG